MKDHACQRLLRAAQNLLSAREDAMVTIDNWEALERAVAECERCRRSGPPAQPPAPPADGPRD